MIYVTEMRQNLIKTIVESSFAGHIVRSTFPIAQCWDASPLKRRQCCLLLNEIKQIQASIVNNTIIMNDLLMNYVNYFLTDKEQIVAVLKHEKYSCRQIITESVVGLSVRRTGKHYRTMLIFTGHVRRTFGITAFHRCFLPSFISFSQAVLEIDQSETRIAYSGYVS